MSGYVPIFGSIFEGTLCGRWPDTGIWTCLLALSDKHGNIDVTPQYISAITGIPMDDLLSCLERFMAPDPQSRTPAEDGRRLVKLDENRGWRIVGWPKTAEFNFVQQSRPWAGEWAVIRGRIFRRDNFTCQYCGQVGGRLECDHMVPVSRGGGHGDDNLTTACFTCNRSKRDKTPGEWLNG